MKTIQIAQRHINATTTPLIIAELSGNHGQSLSLAKEMVHAAAQAGAGAIKLQTYTADSMTLNSDSDDFVIREKDSLWYGESLHALYAKAATPYEWHEELFALANRLGMLAFSSPFDEHAVHFLDGLNVPCFKIASFELTDLPLVRAAAATGKPLIISTGMATYEEIEESVRAAREAGATDIILLKCTSTYPAEPANTHLMTIPHMREAFGCQVGLSDHTQGIGAAVASVALGATVIEKHFVLDRNAGGVDAAFSLEPDELQLLCTEVHRAWQALGQVTYGGSKAEEKAKQYRRSIYVSHPIKAGERLSEKNLKIVRPAHGLEPRYWERVLRAVAVQDLPPGTALDWQHFKE
ncbi:pseudaminic acid synthase [Aestuariibacter salexigens]|uniref:pseudaminic acid synthase n=1 Tax=Aestuariibacter salexigens TaxID=226010 RepID=UPI00041E1DEA|nr:pseudaminic acid synthase [Aestuariibacter salexigens]